MPINLYILYHFILYPCQDTFIHGIWFVACIAVFLIVIPKFIYDYFFQPLTLVPHVIYFCSTFFFKEIQETCKLVNTFPAGRWLIFLLTTGLALAFLAFLLLLTAKRCSSQSLRGAANVQLLGSRREQRKLRRLVLPEHCAVVTWNPWVVCTSQRHWGWKGMNRVLLWLYVIMLCEFVYLDDDYDLISDVYIQFWRQWGMFAIIGNAWFSLWLDRGSIRADVCWCWTTKVWVGQNIRTLPKYI